MVWFEVRGCPLPALKLLQTLELVLSPTMPENLILLMIGLHLEILMLLPTVKSAAGNWVSVYKLGNFQETSNLD